MLRIEELEGVNKISIGFKTSSWGNHPPMFKEHFLFALYLFIFFFFLNGSSVLTGGCPCSLQGFPGSVFTQWVSNQCVPCWGWEEEGTGDFVPHSPAGTPCVCVGGVVFDPHPAARNGAGGGKEVAGECHVDFAPMPNSWPCRLTSCVTLGKSLTLTGLRCLSVKWVL